MFREMRRFKQQVSREECVRVLTEQKRGVLSVIGDDGYPYGLPIDHWYCEEDRHIYFHCGKEGHKIDAIRKCDKVSYCVYDDGVRKDGDWVLHFVSVITFGRIRIVEDEEKMRRICTEITKRFTDDEEYLQKEMESAFSRVACLELIPEHMTGKRITES